MKRRSRDYEEEDDELFDNGILRDGARWRVPMSMMDAMQRDVARYSGKPTPRDSSAFPRPVRGPLITAYDGGTLGLHRPGVRLESGGNRGDQLVRDGAARDRALTYEEYDHAISNAYRDPLSDFGDTEFQPFETRQNQKSIADRRREAYEGYDRRVSDAWRNP